MDYFFILTFILLAFFFVLGGLALSHFVAPRRVTPLKLEPYECGVPTIGLTWKEIHTGYYLFALIFLIFDVESAFLFPWAVIIRETGGMGFFGMSIFISILLIGLLYAWKKGILDWV